MPKKSTEYTYSLDEIKSIIVDAVEAPTGFEVTNVDFRFRSDHFTGAQLTNVVVTLREKE